MPIGPTTPGRAPPPVIQIGTPPGLRHDRRLRPRIDRLRRYRAWRDLGDLKRGLLDLWIEERNALAKEVMREVEA